MRGLPGHPGAPTDVTIGAYRFATLASIVSKAGLAASGFASAWWLALRIGLISSALTVTTGCSTG